MDGTQFEPVSLSVREKYYHCWDLTPQRSIDYTLANLWGWQEYYGLEWLFEGELAWIRQTSPEKVSWAPIGDWHKYDWQNNFEKLSGKTFIRVPEALLKIWRETVPEKFDFEDERGQWEYLYLQRELAELPGNRFHKKRNHLNSYIKAYGAPDYREVMPDMVPTVLNVQDDWCHWHECDDSPSLLAENSAINRVLRYWDSFRNLVAGSLYVEDKMIAFAVGEKLDNKNLGVQYEKGLNGYKGVYQAMNCEFVKHAGKGYEWINRAQDLDEEGLRQAKLTYLPAEYLRKYKVVFK